MSSEADNYSRLPELLYDATLTALEWQAELAVLLMTFDCLRRNADGTEIANREVEVKAEGVACIAAYYNPAKISKRPSEFALKLPFTVRDLQRWNQQPAKATLSVNSRHDRFLMATSWRIDELVGQYGRGATPQNACALHLQFEHDCGDDDCEACLYAEGSSIRILSGGLPLALPEWEKQYAAWRKHWEQHWEDKEADDAGCKPVEEDTFVPAGEESIDESYEPPQKAGVNIQSTDAPLELLAPLRDFLEGHLAKDWQRMARAWPVFDKTATERAQELRDSEYGRWKYLRHVDGWWMEGHQACVTARGIEHSMPLDDEFPAENTETVVEYALRKAPDRWVVVGYSQGWPPHGSARELDGPKPWLDEWDSLVTGSE